MRGIFITILITVLFVNGIVSITGSHIAFNIITFFRPQDLASWSFWGGKPLFQFCLGVLLISNLIHRNFRPKMNVFIFLALGFFAWTIVSSLFSLYPTISWLFFNTYILTLFIGLVIVAFCINSIKDLKIAICSMTIAILILSSKVGLVLSLRGGGHVTQNIDGFVGDNNVFGLCICVVVGCMIGMRNVFKGKLIRIAIIIGIMLSILTILYTQSRGAFLTLAIIFVIGIITNKRPVLLGIVVSSLVLTGYFVLPKKMFNRLNTLENVEKDDSAMHRVVMWENAFKYANSRPLSGLGLDSFMKYNKYCNPHLPALVTHSVYFQVLSNTGYVGLMIYLGLILSTVWTLHTTTKRARFVSQFDPDYYWVIDMSFWMRNSFIGYIFGSAFLDMMVYDIPWYFMLYTSLMGYFTMKREQQIRYSDDETVQLTDEKSVC